jgi:hypothetical protein
MEEAQLLSAICNLSFSVIEARSTLDSLQFGETAKGLVNETYWLSWNIFEETIQSHEFCLGVGVSTYIHSKDVISCKYFFRPANFYRYLPKEIINVFPLTIYLCSKDGIMGSCNLNPFNTAYQDSESQKFPLHYESWIGFTPLYSASALSKSDVDAFCGSQRISLKLEIETTFQIPSSTIQMEVSAPVRTVEDEKPLEKKEEADQRYQNEFEDDEGEPETDTHLSEDIDDNSSRHFRIHLNFYSLRGLLRPSLLSLQFSYPFFGVSNVIRTLPQFFPQKSEKKVEKGIITYDFLSTRNQLKEILAAHPLSLDVFQKSSLGNEILGFCRFSLFPVSSSSSSSSVNFLPKCYKCPVTKQSFPSLSEYGVHYKKLISLYKNKQLNLLPSKEPEIIFLHDQSVDILPATNDDNNGLSLFSNNHSKLRIITIIEDIGKVGKEIAMKVESGYKMQNGGVYDIDRIYPLLQIGDNQRPTSDNKHSEYFKQFLSFLPESSSSNSSSSSGSSLNINNTNHESPSYDAFLDHLLMDWELYRRNAESLWKQSLIEKEIAIRREIEKEYAVKFSNTMNDIKTSHEELNKLEVRLKNTAESIDQEKSAFTIQKESFQMVMKQKLSELALFSKKCKNEAKQEVETMKNEKLILEKNLALQQQSMILLEKKYASLQEQYDSLYQKYKYSNEMKLKEEIVNLKYLITSLQEKLTEQDKVKSSVATEKDYFRSQMFKLANCLKKEKEKNSLLVKQELEHLRLEFLAREER